MTNKTNELCKKEIDIIKDILSEYLTYNPKNFGKMVRSKLALLVLKSVGINPDIKMLKFLSVIELIHNASILHDDVIDNSDTRRNSPSIQKLYSNKTAILYGNMLMSGAIKIATELNNIEIVKIINNAVKNMCEGEIIQITQHNKIPTLQEYINKSELKTAALFIAIFEGLNTFTSELSPQFIEFGRCFGTAYQIKNDLEDAMSDKIDIVNGTYTAPYILSESEDITPASLEKTKSLIDNYIVKAIKLTDDIKNSPYKDELVGAIRCLKG